MRRVGPYPALWYRCVDIAALKTESGSQVHLCDGLRQWAENQFIIRIYRIDDTLNAIVWAISVNGGHCFLLDLVLKSSVSFNGQLLTKGGVPADDIQLTVALLM